MALLSVRFVGGHFDEPDLFDFECRVVRMSPTEIVLQPLDPHASRIILNSRYIGKSIGSVDDANTTTICTYSFEDDTHRGMAKWFTGDDGGITVAAGDY